MTDSPFHSRFNSPPASAEPRQAHRDAHPAGKSCRVILSGQLVHADAQPHTVNCLVLELFVDGARIETDQAAAIPEYLFFRIGAAPLRPVWRVHIQGNSIKLRYLEPSEAMK